MKEGTRKGKNAGRNVGRVGSTHLPCMAQEAHEAVDEEVERRVGLRVTATRGGMGSQGAGSEEVERRVGPKKSRKAARDV